MKKALTLEQVLAVRAALDALDRTGVSMELSGCIAIEKLSMAISPIVTAYERSLEIPEEKGKRKDDLDAYRRALGTLQEVHVRRDPTGNPITVDGLLQFKNFVAYQTAVETLKKMHPIAVEKDNKLEKATSPEIMASLHDVEFAPIAANALSGKITWADPVRVLIRNGVIEA